MKNSMKFLSIVLAATMAATCTDTEQLIKDMDSLSARIDALEDAASVANDNATSLSALMKGKTLIVGYTKDESGYSISLSDGSEIKITFGADTPGLVPLISIDEDGNWIMSTDNGVTFSRIENASNIYINKGTTPQVKISQDGFWLVSTDGGENWEYIYNESGMKLSATDGNYMTGNSSVFANVELDEENQTMEFTLKSGNKVTVAIVEDFYLTVKGFTNGDKAYLGDTIEYDVELSDVASSMILAPEGWDVVLTDKTLHIETPSDDAAGEKTVTIILVSGKGYIKTVNLKFTFVAESAIRTGCQIWNNFVEQNSNNILNDYSYAGYNHGESVPADGLSLGYTVYNVTDYGAIPNDGLSDREAFKKAYQAAIGGDTAVQTPSAGAVIYFPEGEYILHTSGDDTDGVSNVLYVRAGDIVIKGAGRDLTTIVMQDPMLPADPNVLYSSSCMMELKHFSGLSEQTKVTGDAAKGTFSIEVASTTGIAVGDYVCLCLQNNASELIAEELAPYSVESGMTDLLNVGVKVFDYHQVAAIKGNVLTFAEPIMRKVEAKWNWTIQKYPHYNNVGVEDITFKGNCKNNFVHHGSWQDDGAYKPISMTRITNGWIRRCRFTSVSEACSITNCANVTVYDVIFDGNRGHSSIRAQGSSRVFIGATTDISSGNRVGTTSWLEQAGQYHAVGVSKPSLGTVLWRNTWGYDSCFESHATQPRATLIDCCKGGWMQSRQGGDAAQVPNHLCDLTVWNFESTTPFTGTWNWYDVSGKYWKFVMPIMVGFHGEPCVFNKTQCTADESHGTPVDPESLYESQLKLRLGYVPGWLNSLK